MVKIKVEKKMNLAELIQWAWDNPRLAKNGLFIGNEHGSFASFKVAFNHAGNMSLEDSDGDCPGKDTLFTVEVEEEITEETEIPVLLEICLNYEDNSVTAYTTKNECIAYNRDSHSLAFHMINPDGTLSLLWTKDGGMVE